MKNLYCSHCHHWTLWCIFSSHTAS